MVQFFKWYTLAHSQSNLAGCSLPVLSLYRRFIESQLFCLPEFHPLVIRNESHLCSISAPPSQSPNRRISPQISSWFQSCEQFSHPSGCGRPPVVCAQLGTGWVGTAGHRGCTTPGMPGEPSPKQWKVVNLQELPQYLLKSLFPSHAVSPSLWNDPTTPLTSRDTVLSQSF